MKYIKLAIDELEQYRYLLSARENCKNKIIELEERMVRMCSGQADHLRVKSNSSSDDRLCALLDEKDEQIWRLSAIDLKLARFERAMEALPDEDRTVLRLCFIEKTETPEDAA